VARVDQHTTGQQIGNSVPVAIGFEQKQPGYAPNYPIDGTLRSAKLLIANSKRNEDNGPFSGVGHRSNVCLHRAG
jgi:hypothetical protein